MLNKCGDLEKIKLKPRFTFHRETGVTLGDKKKIKNIEERKNSKHPEQNGIGNRKENSQIGPSK